jgi:hypothetical protein
VVEKNENIKKTISIITIGLGLAVSGIAVAAAPGSAVTIYNATTNTLNPSSNAAMQGDAFQVTVGTKDGAVFTDNSKGTLNENSSVQSRIPAGVTVGHTGTWMARYMVGNKVVQYTVTCPNNTGTLFLRNNGLSCQMAN